MKSSKKLNKWEVAKEAGKAIRSYLKRVREDSYNCEEMCFCFDCWGKHALKGCLYGQQNGKGIIIECSCTSIQSGSYMKTREEITKKITQFKILGSEAKDLLLARPPEAEIKKIYKAMQAIAVELELLDNSIGEQFPEYKELFDALKQYNDNSYSGFVYTSTGYYSAIS